MRILKDLWALVLELLLLMAGIPTFTIVAVVGILYTFFKHLLIKRDYAIKRQFLPILRNLNLCFDGFANASAGELLNDTYKIPKNSKIKYGRWYETISAVTGLIYLHIKKIKLRNFLNAVLGKNHCENAITKLQEKYYK